jgi:multiple sugar transport system permease protein
MSIATASDLPVAAPPLRLAKSRQPVIVPWLYILPVVAILGVWIFLPLGRALWLSFYEWNLLPTTPMKWKGLDNYIKLLSLPDMRIALVNTAVYILGLLPLAVVLPLAIAIFTHDLPARARNIYRAMIFVPMIIAPVVVSVVWRWLLNPDHGIVNAMISELGGEPVGFLEDRGIAMWTIIWITGWKLIGFSTLIFAAANANIDHNYIEAARLDGASEWRIIRDIRLPLLSPR